VVAISGAGIVGNMTVGNDAQGMVYNPDNQEVYVALFGPNQVAIISGTKVVATVYAGESPTAIAYDPSDHSVYVVDYGFVGPGAVTLIPSS
jgi:YVTN family beta-propeller protein